MAVGKRIEEMMHELDKLNREYHHAQGRATAHAEKAKVGVFASAMFYDGAVRRMEEIERRMLVIVDRMLSIITPEDGMEVDRND